jgi:hypothetical protein
LKQISGVSNADCGGYAPFASERSGVLKNRTFLNHKSSDPRKQWRQVWMEDADN